MSLECCIDVQNCTEMNRNLLCFFLSLLSLVSPYSAFVHLSGYVVLLPGPRPLYSRDIMWCTYRFYLLRRILFRISLGVPFITARLRPLTAISMAVYTRMRLEISKRQRDRLAAEFGHLLLAATVVWT